MPASKVLDKTILENMIHEHTNEEIAMMFNVSVSCVGVYLKKYGIKRTHEERVTLRLNGIKKKYGVSNVSQIPGFKEKINKTISKKMLTDQNYLSGIKKKREETNLQRRGVRYPKQDQMVIDKSLETRRKHRDSDPTFEQKIVQKRENTSVEIYGVRNYKRFHLSDETKTILEDKQKFVNYIETCGCKKVKELCLKLGISHTAYLGALKRFNIPGLPHGQGVSLMEKELRELITLKTPIETNVKKIFGLTEIDILCRSYNLAIEFNGLYWHSLKRKEDINFHKNKTDVCALNHVSLLQIYEDEWLYYRQNVVNLINYYVEDKFIDFSNIEIVEQIVSDKEIYYDMFEDGKQLIRAVFKQGFYDDSYICTFPFEFMYCLKHGTINILMDYCIKQNIDKFKTVTIMIDKNKLPTFDFNNTKKYYYLEDTDANIWEIRDHKRCVVSKDDFLIKNNIDADKYIFGSGYKVFHINSQGFI